MKCSSFRAIGRDRLKDGHQRSSGVFVSLFERVDDEIHVVVQELLFDCLQRSPEVSKTAADFLLAGHFDVSSSPEVN